METFRVRKSLAAIAAIAAALATAAIVRYALLEPADLAHLCGAPGAPWWCAPRALAAVVLDAGALGYAALAAGVVAIFTRSSVWAVTAACCGAAGLVLYAAATGATGFLIGFLVLMRAVTALPGSPDARRERKA
jgi:hypothetical protein